MILLITFTAIHLAITILFSAKIISWKSKGSTAKPTISIIIAARNEFENLKNLIPKLLEQNYENFEISIGLDRCDDQSVQLLQSFESPKLKWVDIQEVPADWNSKKYALTKAIESSTGEWLVFTDADCEPQSDLWLESISKEIDSKTNVLIGVSPYTSNKTFLSKFIQFEAFMTYFLYCGMTILGRPYMAVGRNMAIRKSYFAEEKGYESIKGIKGGDDDLFIQKGGKNSISLVMGKTSLVSTIPSKSWAGYKNQKLRHHSVSKHYSKLDISLLSIYHLIHLSIFILIPFNFKSSFLIPIILFYLFIKLVGYRFVASKIGAGFNYILFPIVDVLYAFMLPVISIWSKLIKDIEWKN